MREPAMHGIQELMTFIAIGNEAVFAEIVENSELNAFLKNENNWNVEKIALFIHLQTLFHSFEDPQCNPPTILAKNVLSVHSLQQDGGQYDIATLLQETSRVVHPRCHMIWNTVWSYLCEDKNSVMKLKGKKKSGKQMLVLRKNAIVGNDSPSEILLLLVKKVILSGLLHESESNRLTHERRALAMTLVYQLCQIQLPTTLLEEVVLHPTIVSKLFLQTLQTMTKHKGKSSQKQHTLKPLALHILKHIVSSLTHGDNDIERRMAAIRSFLLVHPSFDAVTRTDTISLLVGIESDKSCNEQKTISSNQNILWENYFAFLQKQIFGRNYASENINEAIKYIDRLSHFTRHIFHHGGDETRRKYFRLTSQMFMIGAFFNLESFMPNEEENEDTLEIARRVFEEMKLENSTLKLPYKLRTVLSSRFFSLISEFVTTDEKAKVKTTKTSLIISELSNLQNAINSLESCGALMLNKGKSFLYKGEELYALQLSAKICSILRGLIANVDQRDDFKSFTLSTMLSLILSLGTHMLHPGQTDLIDDDENVDFELQDVDDFFDEICGTIIDICSVAENFYRAKSDIHDGAEGDNLLNEFVAICINIINSSAGGNNLIPSVHLGGGPRLVRECVQLAWGSILLTISKVTPSSESHQEVLGSLLEAICPDEVFSDPMVVDDDDNSSDSITGDDESKSERSTEEKVSTFSQANASGIDLDDIEIDEVQDDTNNKNNEVELDPSTLENLLLEDNDELGTDDEDILEHHEGADKALANLIKLKQEARKAGKSKKEKMELINRQRCFALLEAMFSSHLNKVSSSNQMKLMVTLPLLRYHTILRKSVDSAELSSLSNQGTNAISEKRDLLKKLSLFLDSKICKGSLSKEEPNYMSCEALANQIVVELKSITDKDHRKLCSTLLAVVIKAAGMNDQNISKNLATSIYRDAVKEWSKKRNTKFTALVFDTFIMKCQE